MTSVDENAAFADVCDISTARNEEDSTAIVYNGDERVELSLHQVIISLQSKCCSLFEKTALLQRYWDSICNSLGPYRVIDEFCPYLEETTRTVLAFSPPGMVDFLSMLCDCLEKSLSYVGGALHVEPLLSLLAHICGSENVQIRKKAIRCLKSLVITTANDGNSLDILAKFLCSLMTSENGYIQSASCYVFEAMIQAKSFDLLPSLADSFLRDYLKLYVARKELVRRELITTLPDVLQLVASYFTSLQQGMLKKNKNILKDLTAHNENVEPSEKSEEEVITTTQEYNCNEKDCWKITLIKRIPEALKELARDNSVSVRIKMASTIISMISDTYKDENAYAPWKRQLYELLNEFSENPSWMVRYTVAKKIPTLIFQDYERFGIECLVHFLSDTEIEVRIGFLDSLTQLDPEIFATFLTLEQQSEFLERFRIRVASDFNEFALDKESNNLTFDPINSEFFAESRKKFDWIDSITKNLIPFANLFSASLATTCLFPAYTDLLKQPITQIQLTALSSLLPPCCNRRLLDLGQSSGFNKENCCDCDEINLQKQNALYQCEHALVDLETIKMVFSPASNIINEGRMPITLNSVQQYLLMGIFRNGSNIAENALKSTIEDPNWRLRQSTLLVFTNLFEFIKSAPKEKLQDEVLGTVLTCLSDEACAVRSTAAACAGYLGSMNPDWATNALVPKLIELAENPNYLYRLSISRCLIALFFYVIMPIDPTKTVSLTEFFEIARRPTKLIVSDSVENVRVHFLRCFHNLMSCLDSKKIQQFKEYAFLTVNDILNRSAKIDHDTETLICSLNALCA